MNVNLVKGQAAVAGSTLQDYSGAFQESFNAGMNENMAAQRRRDNERKAVNAKVTSYLESLTEPELINLTPEQQGSVTDFLVNQRKIYADAAKEIAQIDAVDDPEKYAELRNKMNNIKSSFGNLKNQLDKYKEEKVSYLGDFDNGRISNGNSVESLNSISNIYTNKSQLSVGETGQLMFFDDDTQNFKNYSDFEKPFLKDHSAINKFIQANESVFKRGQPLTGNIKDMQKLSFKQLLNNGGRQTLLSLATDDFIAEGGLGLDPELLKPENEEKLKEEVLNSYVGFLEKTAEEGARIKRARANVNNPRAGAGLSKSLQEEIASSGHITESAINFAKIADAKTKNIEDKATYLATKLNSMDPSSSGEYVSRGQAYNSWLEETHGGEHSQEAANEFRKLYPRNYQLFYFGNNTTSPVDMNINDPSSLYEFYVNNSKMSNKAKNYIITNTRKGIQANKGSNKQKSNLDTSKYN